VVSTPRQTISIYTCSPRSPSSSIALVAFACIKSDKELQVDLPHTYILFAAELSRVYPWNRKTEQSGVGQGWRPGYWCSSKVSDWVGDARKRKSTSSALAATTWKLNQGPHRLARRVQTPLKASPYADSSRIFNKCSHNGATASEYPSYFLKTTSATAGIHAHERASPKTILQ
jgi:hypothetical protein